MWAVDSGNRLGGTVSQGTRFGKSFEKSSFSSSKVFAAERKPDASLEFGSFFLEGCIPNTLSHFQRGQVIFSQGELADNLYFILDGSVKRTVVSRQGKEAVIGILPGGQFLGESCLSNQTYRDSTASAASIATLVKIEKSEMKKALAQSSGLSELFVRFLLSRNSRIEGDLVDHLFNSSERRLARLLLMLSEGGDTANGGNLPKISQETLAGMVGTTRSRISFFMNKFRKLGLVDYKGGIQINRELLSLVLEQESF